jgi:hypothetical protein
MWDRGVEVPIQEEIATETWEDVNSILLKLYRYEVCAFDRGLLMIIKMFLAVLCAGQVGKDDVNTLEWVSRATIDKKIRYRVTIKILQRHQTPQNDYTNGHIL